MANEIPTNDGMNIETLKIDIDVSAKKGSSDIENFEKAVSRLEKSLETLNKALSSSEKSIGQLGKQSQKSPNISIYNSNTSSVGGNNAESIMSKIDRKKLAEKNKRDAEIEKKFNQPISEKSSTKTNTFWKSIGHVLKYRLISSAFNLISKGLTEGVEKAALFDDRINDSISNIIGSSKQLINQIGAAGGELIVSFEPVIVRLIEWLTIGADKVTQFFAALNGKDTYDKAVTQAYDFAKSIRGAYGGIGIDELNIFGSGADGGLLSDVQYVEESLDGWAQGISEFRKEMQPTVDWVNDNLDAVLATSISIGTTIAAIKFANSFKDALNKDLATSLVTGSKDLLGNLQTIAAIGTITLGISFLADENSENDGFGALLTAIGSFLGLNKIGQSLGLTKAGAIGWAIPISLILTVGATIATNDYGAYIDLEEQSKALQEKGMSESAADFLSFIGGHIVGAIKGVPVIDFSEQMAGLPVGLPSTDTLSKYYPNQVSGSTNVPYYSFADVINSSRSAEEQNSEKQDEMIYYLAQIASKNPNIILADDDIGRAYERYIGVKGVTMNGGAYANAD